MKLAFFGGTFNPPHKGHEMMIDYCYDLFDQLLIIPNRVSPEKLSNPPISEFHRLNMLNILVSQRDIKIDAFELESNKDNYTYHTLKYLIKSYTFSDLYMIIGEDQLSNLLNWYKIDFILKHVKILCFKRANISKKNHKLQNIEYVPFNCLFSSSRIREMIENNIQLKKETINQEVYKYIEDNNLYK